MSKIYLVVETYYNDYNIVNAWATEEEAVAYCNECYKKNNDFVRSWTNDFKWHVTIDEVVFNGNVVNESI